jgi:hypothetical protein
VSSLFTHKTVLWVPFLFIKPYRESPFLFIKPYLWVPFFTHKTLLWVLFSFINPVCCHPYIQTCSCEHYILGVSSLLHLNLFVQMNIFLGKSILLSSILHENLGKCMHASSANWLAPFITQLLYVLIPPLKCIILNYLLTLSCEKTILPLGDDFLENV